KERLAAWQAARDRLKPGQRDRDLGVWMLRSTDGGLTWSARYDSRVNSPHGPIQLRDGRLLYAGKELLRDHERVGVCQSSDDGKTWEWLAETPAREGDAPRNYHELHAVDTVDRGLVVHIRNHNKANAGEILESWSRDDGKSWSEPGPAGVWGLPSHL